MDRIELVMRHERANERIDRIRTIQEALEVIETGHQFIRWRRNVAAVDSEVYLVSAKFARRTITPTNSGEKNVVHLANQAQ